MPKSAGDRKQKPTSGAARTDTALKREVRGTTPLQKRHLQTPELLVRGFYNRDPRIVARELLGKVLIREERGEQLIGRIVETEAYLGEGDAAAHSAAGHTARNSVIFGPPGLAYVYFIYGVHYCLNVSCLPEGNAGCVLIRALEPVAGLQEMARNREIELDDAPTLAELRSLASGPGRLAEAFGIVRERDNGKDMARGHSDLWIGQDGYSVDEISATPRVGITKAVEEPLRFLVAGNPFVSGKRSITSRR